jgi:hypothetical protein
LLQEDQLTTESTDDHINYQEVHTMSMPDIA